MKKSIIIIVLIISACSINKKVSINSNVFNKSGVLIEFPEMNVCYFIACHKILDYDSDLDNIIDIENQDHSIYLYNFYTKLDDFLLKNRKSMTVYNIDNDEKLRTILVSVSYSELEMYNIDSFPTKSNFSYNDNNIVFSFISKPIKIYEIKRINKLQE